MTTDCSLATLFDSFPEAVLVFQDNRILYRNPAADRIFSGLETDAPVPEELAVLLEGAPAPAVAAGKLGERTYAVTVQEIGGGIMAVLRPAGTPTTGPGLERLCFRLRQETAGLAMALQRLDPTEGELDEERARRHLAAANQGLYRLLRLTDHLEFLDRTDEELYHPRPLDLAGFCRELGAQVESVCRMAGSQFLYESELVSLITMGDERLLRRLILSLVSNSIKAAGEEGRLGLRLSLAKDRKRALLTVWDSGEGLKEGELARLFGELEQEPPSLDPREGLGLGLDAVRRIAELHGGAVMVEGRPQDSLRCVVSLPVRAPEGRMLLEGHKADYAGGFSPLLVELSDVLPVRLFLPEDLM